MNNFTLRLKLLLKDRTACICCIVTVAVTVAVILGLNLHSEERSSLPIGLITEDNGAEARELKESIKNNEALYVYEGSFDELYVMLLDGYINSIFVIEEDYSERVRAGSTAELLSVYAAEDDRISTVVSDIIAGCMMYEICVDKAYNKYSELKNPGNIAKLEKAGYEKYVKELSKDESFSFAFDVSYIDAGTGKLTKNDITNAMIYRQMIAGMLSMLMMLVVFCACNQIASEHELGIASRLKLTGIGAIRTQACDILAITVYASLTALIISGLFMSSTGTAMALKLLLIDMLWLICCATFFCLLAGILKNVFIYQLVGTVLITVFGVMGFISVFEGLLNVNLFEMTPVAVYISEFIKIIS